MLRRLHIDRAALAAGRADPIIIRSVLADGTLGSTMHASRVDIAGPSRFVFDPEHPLASGAYAWIETDAAIRCLTVQDPAAPHMHECPRCRTRWTHQAVSAAEHDAAHRCPRCKTRQLLVAPPRPDPRISTGASWLLLVAALTALGLWVAHAPRAAAD